MKRLLNNLQIIGLDTNLFIYYLDRNSEFYPVAEKLFILIAAKRLTIVTSILTVTELLSYKAPKVMLSKLENELELIPKLKILDVDKAVAKEAARLRREYSFRLPDSIQLATALNQKAHAFITNDLRLKQFKELKIVLLGQL